MDSPAAGDEFGTAPPPAGNRARSPAHRYPDLIQEWKIPIASIMKRKDRPKRPWVVAYREPGSKKQRFKAFKRLKDAEAFRDTVSREIRHGTYVERRPISLKTYAEDWLVRTKSTITENTHAQHEWVADHLAAAFNLTPVQNFTPDQIERWQARLLDRSKNQPPAPRPGDPETQHTLGTRSVEILRNTLGTILEDAKDKGYLFFNLMAKVRRFKVPERELDYLEIRPVKALCQLVGTFYGVLFPVMAFCGCGSEKPPGSKFRSK